MIYPPPAKGIAHVNVFTLAWNGAVHFLPSNMNTQPARAMILAIGLQESRFAFRRQLAGGPARGFWQFEALGGIGGVLRHPETRELIRDALTRLCYDHEVITSYVAIEHNDVLACIYARLLLWTLPQRLPGPDRPDIGFNQYSAAWRPSKPRAETWSKFYADAWEAVG